MSLKRATIAIATFFGLALIASFASDPAAAFTAAQKAACGGDAQRLCSSSMSDPQQLTACMQSNQSKVSSRVVQRWVVVARKRKLVDHQNKSPPA